MQMFDVAVQSKFQPFNLAKNLGTFTRGQTIEVIQGGRAVFDLKTPTVHKEIFSIHLIPLAPKPLQFIHQRAAADAETFVVSRETRSHFTP